MRAACSTVGANGIQERTCAYTMCVAPAILSNTNCTQLHWVCPIECSVEPVQITPSLVRKDLRPDLRIRLDLLSGTVPPQSTVPHSWRLHTHCATAREGPYQLVGTAFRRHRMSMYLPLRVHRPGLGGM
jgi:hypothetical protein